MHHTMHVLDAPDKETYWIFAADID